MGPWALATMSRYETEARRQRRTGLVRADRRPGAGLRPERRLPRRAAVKAWLGYRLIGVGCRLARPSLVAGARAGL